MCVRLYPDIIVAMEIETTRSFEDNPDKIFVYIGNCLAHQKTYASYGVSNAFIGFEGEVWKKEDYIAYFKSLPQFFTQTDNGYLVNMEALKKKADSNDKSCNKSTPDKSDTNSYSYYKLFTQGTYGPDVLRALSLIP